MISSNDKNISNDGREDNVDDKYGKILEMGILLSNTLNIELLYFFLKHKVGYPQELSKLFTTHPSTILVHLKELEKYEVVNFVENPNGDIDVMDLVYNIQRSNMRIPYNSLNFYRISEEFLENNKELVEYLKTVFIPQKLSKIEEIVNFKRDFQIEIERQMKLTSPVMTYPHWMSIQMHATRDMLEKIKEEVKSLDFDKGIEHIQNYHCEKQIKINLLHLLKKSRRLYDQGGWDLVFRVLLRGGGRNSD